MLDRMRAKQLQARLARLGFAPGPIDGILGSRTRGAVRRYQTANKLPATGDITRRLLEHLELDQAPRKAPATLGTADLPAYRPGTAFVYSDGNTERVTGVKGGIVQWARKDGLSYAAHRNFLMPRSYWASANERGTAKISADPEGLWPLRESAEVKFEATLKIQSNQASDVAERRVEQWRCRNEGAQRLAVGAGSFDTVVLTCRGGEKGAAPALGRTWYYAREIRHYVRFVETDLATGLARRTDLVAARPGTDGWPPIVRAALTRAVIRALEAPESEARIPWRSSGVKVSVVITADAPFAGNDGRTCRRFVQIWTRKGLERRYPGVACRTAREQWEIPGARLNKTNALAISGNPS